MTRFENTVKGLELLKQRLILQADVLGYGYHISDIDNALELLKAKDINVPTKWVSVKDRLPEEHPSIFASCYGTEKWAEGMWRNESDRVLVTILFPDGTRTVDKGKLQDGTWKTGVSPALPQVVTHWAMWPEPPKENEEDDE